jgi:Fe-S-cluster containining protein
VVYISSDEAKEIAEYLDLSISFFYHNYLHQYNRRMALNNRENEDCIFLEERRCKVYEARPVQCRRWPFWERIFKNPSDFRFARSYCEGLKNLSHGEFKNTWPGFPDYDPE